MLPVGVILQPLGNWQPSFCMSLLSPIFALHFLPLHPIPFPCIACHTLLVSISFSISVCSEISQVCLLPCSKTRGFTAMKIQIVDAHVQGSVTGSKVLKIVDMLPHYDLTHPCCRACYTFFMCASFSILFLSLSLCS